MTKAVAFTQIKRRRPQKGLPAASPDWKARSVLTLAAGKRFRMRNGHTAEIRVSKTLTYGAGKSERRFVIWYGRCVECNEAFGWNDNGTYAAVGKHPLDLVKAV